MNRFQIVTLLVMSIVTAKYSNGQKAENWTSKQLIQPAELAKMITSKQNLPVLFCVGPAAPIPASIDIGSGKEKENIDKLKKELGSYSVDKDVVVYCGCCPFEHCPNVRPAINALKEMKFTNYRLLNLPNNIKTDWMDKGYPVVKQ